MKEKKCSFTKTMHCVTSRLQQWQLHELHFELLLHPPYSPNLAPSDYWLFTDLKRMLQGKRFGFNEKMISETEAYFEAKDKSFYKKGIELLEMCWNQCITLEEDLINKVGFCLKVVVLLVRPWTYWVMCYAKLNYLK